MFAWIVEYRAEMQEGMVFLLFGLALWRGAAPEKIISAAFVGMWVIDRLYHLFVTSGSRFGQVDPVHLGIDAIATIVLLLVALKANRLYPLWLTALQLAATLSHLFRAASPSLQGGAYSIFIVAPSYLQIPSFAIALLLHIRRVQKHGPYPSWQNFSRPLRDQGPRR